MWCSVQKMSKPTPLRDAVLLIWTLPRAKKHVTGMFFASPYGDAALFESLCLQKIKDTQRCPLFFGTAKGTRLHFHSQRGMKIKVSPGPPRRATVHRTVAFRWFEPLSPNKKARYPNRYLAFLVRRKGLEPPTY